MIRSLLLPALALLLASVPGSASPPGSAWAPGNRLGAWGAAPLDPVISGVDRSGLWYPPLGRPFHVSTPYRAPPTPYAAGHRGIDLPAAVGDEVFAPASGTVSFVGTVVDRPVVSIRVDSRTVVSLEPVEAAGLAEGASIARGGSLGVIGAGGQCDVACLHLGVRVDGDYVNPTGFFVERPVLLPW